MQLPSVKIGILVVLSYIFLFAESTYTLLEDYPVDSFYDKFDFYSGSDPTHGFVQYVEEASATLAGLVSTANGSVIIRPEAATILDPCPPAPGRQSIRLESKSSYNHGLFIVDVKRMPGGVCGTWPAFWLLGSNAVWPAHGEIDIIEGVNENTNNQMTLHTSAGCFTRAGDCLGQNNAGCAIIDPTYGSFGAPFNQNGGGVFAAEWTANSIKIWFFPRTSPFLSNVLSNSPDPSLWGNASGDFEAGQGCVFEDHFKDLRIVINLTFCGDWAGSAYSSSNCDQRTGMRCVLYVATHPADFANLYWDIQSLRVFQQSVVTTGSTPEPTATAQHPLGEL